MPDNCPPEFQKRKFSSLAKNMCFYAIVVSIFLTSYCFCLKFAKHFVFNNHIVQGFNFAFASIKILRTIKMEGI